MRRAFEFYFRSLVKQGSLTVDMPGGPAIFGDGTGPDLAIKIADRSALWALLVNPVLKFGELYMDHRIEVTRGSIRDILFLGSRNILHSGAMDWTRILDHLRAFATKLDLGNTLTRSRANVAHHYDLDRRLYALFLDQDWQYSCAYFEHPDDSLDTAQLAKKRHIAAKLLIEPGHRVLDIGSGWGGMALYLAQFTGATVTGITLSQEQLTVARARAQALPGQVSFELEDYRHTEGRYDRVVSVGMLEHTGLKNYETYFRRVADLLNDRGVALIHTIGRSLGPAPTNAWLLKYIFPGGYIPALSELTPAIEAAGLFITDIETLRLHYAETIQIWSENFAAHREQARGLYGERFCRMWEFYLAGAESAFREEKEVVFQIQLAKKVDTVPLTRNYILEWEEALRQIDTPQQVWRPAGRQTKRVDGTSSPS
jgi:cyclopropane-fatty-acyl-phospholipid synthase